MKITPTQIIKLHQHIGKIYPLQVQGVRDYGSVEYIASEIKVEKDPFSASALALTMISQMHPFWDGNKRTAYLVAKRILGSAGYKLWAKESDVKDMMLTIARGDVNVDNVIDWLESVVVEMNGNGSVDEILYEDEKIFRMLTRL
jgi:death-on-curing protein